jgi:hypothetical protein
LDYPCFGRGDGLKRDRSIAIEPVSRDGWRAFSSIHNVKIFLAARTVFTEQEGASAH